MADLSSFIESRRQYLNPDAEQPAAPQQPAANDATSQSAGAPAPAGGSPLAAFAQSRAGYLQKDSQEVLDGVVGRTPQTALPESPLSAIERGRLGWIQDGGKQLQYLTDKFGEGNAKMVKMDDNNAGWVVKSSDGKWRQVDPAGLSDVPSQLLHLHFGKAYQEAKQALTTSIGLSNAIGGAAQFLGSKGLKAAGAAEVGGEGAAIGGSIAGPVGALAGGAIGGALGSFGGEGIDLGVREVWHGLSKLYGQATGNDLDPYSKLATPEDLKQQVASSLMFGSEQELANAGITAGLKGTTGLFGAIAKRMADTPEGQKALSGMLSAFGGVSKNAAETFASASQKVSDYIPQAVKDYYQKTDNLYQQMKGSVESVYNDLLKKRGELGSQYNEIEAAAKQARFDPMAVNDAGENQMANGFQQLVDERYIDGKGNLAPDVKGMGRDLTDTDRRAIQTAVAGFQKLQKLGKDASYQDLQIYKQNLDKYIWGTAQVADGKLGAVLKDLRNGALDTMQTGLEKSNPEIAQQFAELNSKYGPVKDLLEQMGKKVDGSRLDTFLKRIQKNDGSYDSNLLSAVSEVTGKPDATDAILQMDAARQFAPGFIGPSFGHTWKIPASPRGAAAVGGAASDLMRGVGTISRSVNDVAQKPLILIHDIYKRLPSETRASIARSPEALDKIGQMYAGSVVDAHQQQQQLMQQAGSFMQSQFGGGGSSGQ